MCIRYNLGRSAPSTVSNAHAADLGLTNCELILFFCEISLHFFTLEVRKGTFIIYSNPSPFTKKLLEKERQRGRSFFTISEIFERKPTTKDYSSQWELKCEDLLSSANFMWSLYSCQEFINHYTHCYASIATYWFLDTILKSCVLCNSVNLFCKQKSRAILKSLPNSFFKMV